jgi:group I intron endonuclease
VIYLVTNKVTGKQYVGLTKQIMQRRWRGHVQAARYGVQTALYSAIRKYGDDAFLIEVIASCIDRSSSGIVESAAIVQFGTKSPQGYNLTDGGEGVRGLPREIVERTALINRGRKHSLEVRRLIGLASIGRKMTDAGRQAISAARLGKPLSDEHRAKLAAAKLGKKLTKRSFEHCAKISDGLRAAHARRRVLP